MPPAIQLGPIVLRVRRLEPMLTFYAKDMGLGIIGRRQSRNGEVVELSPSVEASAPLLVLHCDPNARPSPRNAAGLYHYAILLPDRKSLGAAYLALGQAGVYFDGSADHLVSEALYLTDPEGNGIELYADRPRAQWTLDDARRVRMATLPLDLDALLAEVRGVPHAALPAIAPGAQIGHVHLKVTALDRSVDFYRGMLGLDLMAHWGSAAFLSVGEPGWARAS